MKRQFGAMLAACLLLKVGALAAYLESDEDSATPATPDVAPSKPGIPVPPAIALKRLAPRLEVGAAIRHLHMTVYPLLLRERFERLDIHTLDEALDRDILHIREKQGGIVDTLQIRNSGMQPVFLMAGEIVLGGKQDRMIRDDILLPARSAWINAPVYCGERDRWRDSGEGFTSRAALAPPGMRNLAAQRADQNRVWNEIDRQLDGAGIAAPTRRYQELYEHADTRRALDGCVAAFSGLAAQRTVGVAVMSGHRILGCDVFSDPRLFARLWPKISRSYALEALTQTHGPPASIIVPRNSRPEEHGLRRPPWPPHDRIVRRFLAGIQDAGAQTVSNPGLGHRYVLSGAVSGSGLEWRSALIHAAIFP